MDQHKNCTFPQYGRYHDEENCMDDARGHVKALDKLEYRSQMIDDVRMWSDSRSRSAIA